MKTLTLLAALIWLSGCETCREHPTACTVAVTVAAGCVMAIAWHGAREQGAPAPLARERGQ